LNKNKNAPVLKDEGGLNVFLNGIILIVNCFDDRIIVEKKIR